MEHCTFLPKLKKIKKKSTPKIFSYIFLKESFLYFQEWNPALFKPELEI